MKIVEKSPEEPQIERPPTPPIVHIESRQAVAPQPKLDFSEEDEEDLDFGDDSENIIVSGPTTPDPVETTFSKRR